MTEITVDAAVENIEEVTNFVDQELESLACPYSKQVQIDVAIDEIFSNIAQYAYGQEMGTVTVRLDAEVDPPAVTITFIDSGVPYNPLERADPDTTLPLEEREVGGLGIFLVKKTMDEMHYEYRDGQNILTLKKRFEV